MFEILHFRGSDQILKEKNLLKDVQVTMEYIDDVLTGSLYKRELLRMALEGNGLDPGRRLHANHRRQALHV
jgi:hypothetical protein